MVTNYTPDKCRYTIGKLVKSVWLISENAIKDIRIDNGEAWVNSISETPIRIDCTSVGLQEEESLDERYRFVHTLTFSVNGYANGDDFQDKYYAIVKDNNDTYWLVNPLFPCKVTYVYTLSNDENHTDFTLSTASNHPVLRLNGMVDARAYECKEYFIDGISELWLNEKRYSVHDGKDVKYTNDGFKVIDYNKNSATFTETFDGTNTSHSISFDVLFSSYKSSWHYNLLEFIDECIKNNNLYSAIIKTRNGKYAMCGFSYGLQPSFNITADDTTQEINKVQISLQDVHTVGDPIDFYNSADYEHLTAKTWVYTAEHNGYECVGDGLAKYLLQKEVDALGNDTCNYKALAGYVDRFPDLNIIGTFNDIVTFANAECVGFGNCELETSLSNLTFNETGSVNLYLKCDSDWSIQSSAEHIVVSPSSGEAGVEYNLVVTNTKEPSSSADTSTLTLDYCYIKENEYTVKVREYDGCLPKGHRYWVDAPATTLTIPSRCCINKITETTAVGVTITLYTNYFTVYVPQNETGNKRVILLVIEYCDGSSQTVEIHQDNVFVEWREEGEHFCIYANEYKYERMYSGYTPNNLVITDEIREVFVESGSELCDGVLYRWVATGEEGCEGCDAGDFMMMTSAKPYTEHPITGNYSNSIYGTKGDCYQCGVYFPSAIGAGVNGSVPRGFYLCLGDDLISFWVNEESGCTTTLYGVDITGGYENEIVLPSRITSFPSNLFSGSSAVQITIPNMVTSIPPLAFSQCRYLKTLIIGSGLQYIYNSSFSSDSIENIILFATTPPIVKNEIPSLPTDLKVFVPKSALAAYKMANGWSQIQNKIYSIE